jgi:transcriptional regulator with XRE-family HTH domain
MNTPGRKVRTVRVWLGINQQDLADQAAVERAYISNFENDKIILKPQDLEAIKTILGIKNLDDPIEKILTELEPPARSVAKKNVDLDLAFRPSLSLQ